MIKARNLPNRKNLGKQDPYCVVRMGLDAQRTHVVKRGGQTPEWDDEFRFEIESDDPGKPFQVYNSLRITVFNDAKEPDLIGDTTLDLRNVYKKGEFDEWVSLKFRDRYAGEVYIEMTFYSTVKHAFHHHSHSVQSNKQPTTTLADLSITDDDYRRLLPANPLLNMSSSSSLVRSNSRPLPANPSQHPSPAPTIHSHASEMETLVVGSYERLQNALTSRSSIPNLQNHAVADDDDDDRSFFSNASSSRYTDDHSADPSKSSGSPTRQAHLPVSRTTSLTSSRSHGPRPLPTPPRINH